MAMKSQPLVLASAIALAHGACISPPQSATPKFSGEPANGNAVTENRYIVVDQFGYRPDMKKVAILVDPQQGWNAKDEYVPGQTLEVRRFDDGARVMSGKPQRWLAGATQANAGDRGAWFDFSELKEPGSYFIFDRTNAARSVRFEIRSDVYRDVLKAAVRTFYFNRANSAKVKPFACVREKCWLTDVHYLGPGQDKE